MVRIGTLVLGLHIMVVMITAMAASQKDPATASKIEAATSEEIEAPVQKRTESDWESLQSALRLAKLLKEEREKKEKENRINSIALARSLEKREVWNRAMSRAKIAHRNEQAALEAAEERAAAKNNWANDCSRVYKRNVIYNLQIGYTSYNENMLIPSDCKLGAIRWPTPNEPPSIELQIIEPPSIESPIRVTSREVSYPIMVVFDQYKRIIVRDGRVHIEKDGYNVPKTVCLYADSNHFSDIIDFTNIKKHWFEMMDKSQGRPLDVSINGTCVSTSDDEHHNAIFHVYANPQLRNMEHIGFAYTVRDQPIKQTNSVRANV